MLSAQHSDPANVMSTTSGDANPANATTRTSTVAAEADGATMLVPNAIVRAEPTTPRASPPASSLPATTSLPSPALRRKLSGLAALGHACLPPQFSLDVIKVAQDHRTAHRLEKCGSGYGQYRDARAAEPAAARNPTGFRSHGVEAPPPGAAPWDGQPVVADRPADTGRFPPHRLGHRTARLREDHAAVAVGRARRSGHRVGVGRRAGQRSEGPAQLRGRSADAVQPV